MIDFAFWALGWVVAVYYFVKYECLRMRTDPWIHRAVSLARKQKLEPKPEPTIRIDMAKLEPSEN